ncbi:competence protein ComEC [Caldicellulosiruptor bescii]|uniref:DNA internalization-related competence protein ComEC/Rec2 n=2 Tax=Caldicellulosiruptor bescii TaxID=31899 RepID=B9ML01_CALBD|nr:DNA internalization-related competence protein ComEC/Rec2 [Caldicellulosiruptor bescii]ACM61009.1 DNA internalization-related competence protein ComEC/Rec2 [Caldicellulosiruptor bescii DSM 6725]PBC89177.1 competence protein ComEC [Caldicellulosiruptor bescii]PBC91341.1 competence protein ComEC [Caldicellulosiruptor bescii]PBD03247.1 competence protein ComEC [Caldicellulosiruptor bescii]PBD07139.1 competence protein ComEC [Caldicellulosiruptor bescii]
MTRKALFVASFMMIGIVLGRNIKKIEVLVFCLLLILGALCATYYFLPQYFKKEKFMFILCFLFLTLQLFRTYYIFNILEPQKNLDGKHVYIVGNICSFPEISDKKTSFYLKTKLNSKAVVIRVTTESKKSIFYGDTVKVSGKLKIPKGKTSKFGFDYREYLKGKGAIYTLYSKDIEVIYQGKNVLNLLNRFSTQLNNLIDSSFENDISSLLKGLILGNKSTIPDDVYKDFQRSGLAHLLAVSGGNVGVLCAFVEILFRRILKIYGKGVNFLIIGVIVIFAIVTGMSASVVRASIMAIIFYAGRIIYRNPDTLNSLSVSSVLMLLVNPLFLFDIGFQLSFLSVLSIILFCKGIYEYFAKLKIPRGISSLIAVSISAQILILPLIAYYFSEISVISFLTNIVAVPVAGAVVPAGLLYCLLLVFNIDILPFKWFLEVCVNVLMYLSRLSYVGFSHVKVILWDEKLIFCYYLVVASLIFRKFINRQLKYVIYLSICGLLVAFILQTLINYNRLIINVIDVGQGDSSFITYKGFSMLIDTGPEYEDFSSLKRIVLPYILKRGVAKLDVLVLTHKHSDHMGDFEYLLYEMKVDTIVTSKEVYFENAQKFKGQKVVLVDSLKVYRYKDLKAYFIPPVEEDENSSVVVKLTLGNFSMLFTGDASYESEKEYVKKYNLQTKILKVGHHGSSTATSEEFLENVKPTFAVISVGKDNIFGHPSNEVLQRLKDRNIKVYRTDLNGTIDIIVDRNKMMVNPYIVR